MYANVGESVDQDITINSSEHIGLPFSAILQSGSIEDFTLEPRNGNFSTTGKAHLKMVYHPKKYTGIRKCVAVGL
jgi:hypothetical protein